MKREFIYSYNMPIFDNSLSYWSMHFIAVLECLAYHKTLQYPARKLYHYPIFSLANMKGSYQNGFFDQMARAIQNWGMQYFIIQYLNHKIGLDIVDKIKENLDGLFNIVNYKNYDDFEFYVSGLDSELSKDISKRYDEIYPKTFDLDFRSKNLLENNSDFCLVLKNTEEDKNIGIFGEIEGNYGEKLFKDSFWEEKSELCVLGIGTIQGNKKGIYYLEPYWYKSKHPKLNIIFERENYIVNDFYRVINEFQVIFNYGPQYKNFLKHEPFGFLVDMIIERWNLPVEDILNQLYEYKKPSDELIGEMEDKPLNLIPSIVV